MPKDFEWNDTLKYHFSFNVSDFEGWTILSITPWKGDVVRVECVDYRDMPSRYRMVYVPIRHAPEVTKKE